MRLTLSVLPPYNLQVLPLLSKILGQLSWIKNLTIYCSTDPEQAELVRIVLSSVPVEMLKFMKIELQGNERRGFREQADGVTELINKESGILSRFIELSDLRLGGLVHYCDDLFNTLAGLPLTKLKLGSKDRPTRGRYLLLDNLVKIKSITSLSLHGHMYHHIVNCGLTSHGGFNVLGKLPLLKKLTISRSKGIYRYMGWSGELFGSLEKFKVVDEGGIELELWWNGIQRMSKLKKLVMLDVNETFNSRYTGYYHPIGNLPVLEYLQFPRDGISGSEIEDLIREGLFPSLKVVLGRNGEPLCDIQKIRREMREGL